MDVVPKPDQVVAAAGNLAQRVLRGGYADLRPVPRTLVASGEHRAVLSYRLPGEQRHDEPVLLVPPLAAPAGCYDLRRGCSLVERLVATGRPTYVVEYGEVSFRTRSLALEPWVEDVVPTAVREVSLHAGGHPVHLVGWSLGGLLALLATAREEDLPVASLSLLAAPVDIARVPLVAPLRSLLDLGAEHGLLPRLVRVAGSTPAARWATQLGAFQRLVGKPVAVATRYDDADFLAQVEAVGRLASRMQAYPGRTYGQLYHRFLGGHRLAEGEVDLGGGPVRLADVAVPVLVVAGTTDGIAPVAAVRAAEPLLTGAPEVRFEIVPGGHLGVLTGRAARDTTWPLLVEWLGRCDPADGADTAATIGTRRRRRYGSGGSRSLAR